MAKVSQQRQRLDQGVYIEGLRDFARQCGRIGDGSLQKGVRDAHYDAAKHVVDAARDIANNNRTARKVVRSRGLTPRRSARQAAVVLKNHGRTPFAFGAEFGSIRYHQFRPWVGNQWHGWDNNAGYFLHPAINNEHDAILEDYWDRITSITDGAFPD